MLKWFFLEKRKTNECFVGNYKRKKENCANDLNNKHIIHENCVLVHDERLFLKSLQTKDLEFEIFRFLLCALAISRYERFIPLHSILSHFLVFNFRNFVVFHERFFQLNRKQFQIKISSIQGHKTFKHVLNIRISTGFH